MQLLRRPLTLCGAAPGRRATSSVPASIQRFVPASSTINAHALERLQAFFRATRLFVITGAGLSTESGIPDYRSDGVGLYARKDRRHMQHAEYICSAQSRQLYWPNSAHLALQQWEEQGKVHWLVTQNVDALHSKAGHQGLTELHGCAHRMGGSCPPRDFRPCCGAMSAGEVLQKRFAALNPGWVAQAGGVAPDRDTSLRTNRSSTSDSIIAGSSLQVVQRPYLFTADQKSPAAILNNGPTRADHLAEFRVRARCGEVLSVIQPH
uniref:Sirtuin 4 n=1 Tax=Salmo trutta TaxID=8032 RepID=A0A674DQC1_SALTR